MTELQFFPQSLQLFNKSKMIPNLKVLKESGYINQVWENDSMGEKT